MKKTNPSFNSPSPFSLSNPFFAQTITIVIVIAIHHDDRQQHMWPALSPLPAACSEGSGSNDSSQFCKYLAVAACKSFPPAFAHIRSAKQDDNYGASNITLPCPGS
jgi:hypothetical protein